jgi:hypothetical protein
LLASLTELSVKQRIGFTRTTAELIKLCFRPFEVGIDGIAVAKLVEVRVIHRARLYGLLHCIVDVEDHMLRAVFAVRLLVLAFDKGEGCQNAVPIVAPDAVEVEGGRVGLT